ncbi:MAG TPA: NAD(P)H-dependent oxidoreductase subunit E [Actinomycetota bacterium]|jgi:NADH-quinone oxidoreductase subunit F|nr:NAD(P)H-dependent oxidoreductase subunit E [Actinomycetota bacterium]
MDLRLMRAAPSEAERQAVDAVLGPPASGWRGGEWRPEREGRIAVGGRRGADGHRHLLLPALHALQSRVGWIDEGGLNYVCERLSVPPAEAYGVATFYAMFSVEPRPVRVAHVCDDIACRVRGARELRAELERSVGPPGSVEGEAAFTWMPSPCLGLCERAPAVLFQTAGDPPRDWAIAPTRTSQVLDVLRGDPWTRDGEGVSGVAGGDRRLLRRVGVVDATSLDDYRAHGGYESLRRAFRLGPGGVIQEVKDARLLGRGGAAFPTGVKWEAVAAQPIQPHFFVCNADESEPGTFKDRIAMEEDPFAVVEALTIAGYATGAERGFIYLRGEYPLALRRLEHAVDRARARGFLGADVMGEGFAFDIEVRRGAGAYIAGEETALFNSIEGRRAEPRNKPPFPVTHGLFGKPTGINNVETLLNVLEILRIGGPAFAGIGTEDSTGTRLFCLSGSVRRPGLYEVPFGTTLRRLLEMAGGVGEERQLRAVLLGGAAGAFVTPEELDMPLTFEDARRLGVSLGSGVVMAFDDTVDLTDIVLRIAAFFRDESCGQCVPCRVGTVRQEELLHRLAAGEADGSSTEQVALLADIARVMGDASICGLGQTAANAVRSAVERLGLFRQGDANGAGG